MPCYCCCCCCYCWRTAGSNQLSLAELTKRNYWDATTFSLWCVTSCSLERSRGSTEVTIDVNLSNSFPTTSLFLPACCPFPAVFYLLGVTIDAKITAVSYICQQDKPHFHLLWLDCGIYRVHLHHWGQRVLFSQANNTGVAKCHLNTGKQVSWLTLNWHKQNWREVIFSQDHLSQKKKKIISICSKLNLALWLCCGSSLSFHKHTWKAKGRESKRKPSIRHRT